MGKAVVGITIKAVYVRRTDDPEARALMKKIEATGYLKLKEIRLERVYLLEGSVDVQELLPLLVHPLFESWGSVSGLDPEDGPIIEIRHKRPVTEPQTRSILEGAAALGVTGLDWARLSYRYQFVGADEAAVREYARRELFNPVIQEVIESGTEWDSLKPHGIPAPVRHISLVGLSHEELVRLSAENSWYVPLEQMKALQEHEKRRGRPFTDAEIEMVVQSWSDHCYHTTWKSLGLLKKLQQATHQIDHPAVVSVFSDNAGGIEFFEDQVVFIKGETHNFPTSIAPFGGVATKHGGVIRDALGFGKGGYPIGGSTIMGTMDPRLDEDELPEGALHPATIVRESIRATAYYCNPMGIPMMYPVYRIHPRYAKCFALGHSIGIIPREYAVKDKPQPGDLAVLIGGRTGRDGIHGATASSAGMTGETAGKESAAVQIGDPITERKFMTAIPYLRDAGCIRAITDLGAGGISSAVGEMAKGVGADIDLDAVLLKDESLTAWEVLLSESQERMLLVVPPDKQEEMAALLGRFDLEYSVLGRFTGKGVLRAKWQGEVVVDIDLDFLWGGCPIPNAEVQRPQRQVREAQVPEPTDLDDLWSRALGVVGHYHCCDQSPAGFQFDSTVQGRTVIGPYGGVTGKMPTGLFVSAPMRGKPYGVASSVSFSPLWGDLDPAGMARMVMVDAIARIVAAGADPGAIALCDNFYTPRLTPEVGWQLTSMVEAICDFSVKLGMPFVSGKDSSSGTFVDDEGVRIDVPYTLAVATLGRVPDVRRLVTKPLKKAGNKLFLLGRPDRRLGGSVYLDTLGEQGGALPEQGPDWADGLLTLWRTLFSLYQDPNCPIVAAAPVGEGGLLVRLFEMAYGGGLGAKILLPSGERWDRFLFAESVGTIIVELSQEADPEQVFGSLPVSQIGEVTKEPALELVAEEQAAAMPLDELVRHWEKLFKEIV